MERYSVDSQVDYQKKKPKEILLLHTANNLLKVSHEQDYVSIKLNVKYYSKKLLR